MKKPLQFFLFVLIASLLVSVAMSQSAADPAFTLVQDIGLVSPQGVQYDPNFDRFVMVDAGGQLVLADALTREVQYVIYARGSYYGYRFSHDGRWLAVAQTGKVDIWNTQTGELDLELVPTVALGFSSRLEFSDDDSLLLFKAIVPAPDDIRRSENDTTLTPWLWDLEAERRNRSGILPEQRRAQPFFDMRTELLLTPNNKLIAALPRSILVNDFMNGSYETLSNLETERFEFDPIDVWYSMRGENAYFRSKDGTLYHQINTQTGFVHPIPVGRELNYAEIAQQRTFDLSDTAQIIGSANSLQSNSFLRLLLTDRYHPNESPLTVMLLDSLQPVTIGKDQTAFLLYIFNEETGRGVIDLIRPAVSDIALNPARTHVAVLRGDRLVEIYELKTGNLLKSIVTGYPRLPQNDIFEFNLSGDALLVGWGRYDVYTGEVLREAPRYHPGVQTFVFSNDDKSIITINDNELWQWDIVTGEPINRETIQLNGELIATSADATRYLTRLPYDWETIENGVNVTEPDTSEEDETELFDAEDEDPDVIALLEQIIIPSIQMPAGNGVEIYDVTTGERRQVKFEQLPDSGIRQVIVSPDWEYLMVVYYSNYYSPYYPGNEVAIYSVDEGLLWFYAGDDLPAPRYRRYGWSDEHTAFVLSGNSRSTQPQRIYGLDYHPSGLPACLVQAFPDEWTQWRDLWEQFNAKMKSDDLGRLTQTICNSSLENVQVIEAILSPTPTPTRPPIQPTSSRIAGLPACISSYFPGQAAAYAPQWRALTEGLDDTQIAEVEEILCAGLRAGVNVPVPNVSGQGNKSLQVVSIDVLTGERSLSAFAPLPVEDARPLAPVLAKFREQFGFDPSEARLSNNAQLLAIRTLNNHVRVYHLTQPYQSYIDSLEATRTALEANQPVSVSLLATATAPALPLGKARPTLTPTMTPTSPPRAEATIAYPDKETIIELCDDLSIHSIFEPPADYSASGHLLTFTNNANFIIAYDTANGHRKVGYELADANYGRLSPDANWLLVYDAEIVVSRADGTDPVVLYEEAEQSEFPYDIFWIDNNTLKVIYDDYLPEVQQETVLLQRLYNVQTGEFTAPITPTPQVKVNEISTSGFLQQPLNGSKVVLIVAFNAGYKEGYRYYLYDMLTEEIEYFARVSDGSSLELNWSANGDYLYYRYPDMPIWYVYTSATNEHSILGDLPAGAWSRDGRYRIQAYLPDSDEIADRLENNQPIPKIRVWDSQTGLTRQYCIPQTRETAYFDTSFYWSPDNRYVTFTGALPDDSQQEDIDTGIIRQRTWILDIETGSLTELARDVNQIIVWTE